MTWTSPWSQSSLTRVQAYPEKTAFEYLRSNGESAGLLSYGELLIRATAIAAYLQRAFLPGERLLLLFSPGLDFITSFFGCLLAAMVPIPWRHPEGTALWVWSWWPPTPPRGASWVRDPSLSVGNERSCPVHGLRKFPGSGWISLILN